MIGLTQHQIKHDFFTSLRFYIEEINKTHEKLMKKYNLVKNRDFEECLNVTLNYKTDRPKDHPCIRLFKY